MRIDEIENSFPEEAYDIIYEYVTYGSMQKTDQFDTNFDRLMQLIPRQRKSMILYRVLNLDIKEIEEIKTKPLILHYRKYSSWTKNISSLDRLLFDRDTKTNVVIRKTYEPQNIVIDVKNFYTKYKLNNRDFEEWDRYVRPENEVIVSDPTSLIISYDMIYDIKHPSMEKILPPSSGTKFINTSGKWERMEELASSDDQPGNNIFAVYVDGVIIYIRQDSKKRWVEIDR